jgi:hypothetical protein
MSCFSKMAATTVRSWRGRVRVHATVFRELDHRLLAERGFGVDAYGVLSRSSPHPRLRFMAGAAAQEQRGVSISVSPGSVQRP